MEETREKIYISMENYNTVFWVLNCLFSFCHSGFVTYLYTGWDPEFSFPLIPGCHSPNEYFHFFFYPSDLESLKLNLPVFFGPASWNCPAWRHRQRHSNCKPKTSITLPLSAFLQKMPWVQHLEIFWTYCPLDLKTEFLVCSNHEALFFFCFYRNTQD